jgi:putative membrane protein
MMGDEVWDHRFGEEPLMKYSSFALFTGLVLAAFPALAAQSPSDFVTEAMKGDNSEIKLGQLAAGKASSSGLRDFGKTLVADHRAAKQAMADAASAMGVTPTDEPSPEALAEYTKLNGMSGASFDREFARYMVSDHEKDIKEFEAQASSGDKTSSIAQQQLPTLRKHLAMARALEGGRRRQP